MGVKWLPRQIAYPGPHLALCITQEQFEEICEDYGYPKEPYLSSSAASMRWYEGEDGTSSDMAVVCIKPLPKRDELVAFGMLVHEATHVWQKHAASLGEHSPADEQEAYAIQFISQNLMREYRRLTNRAKKCIAKSAEIPPPSLIPEI